MATIFTAVFKYRRFFASPESGRIDGVDCINVTWCRQIVVSWAPDPIRPDKCLLVLNSLNSLITLITLIIFNFIIWCQVTKAFEICDTLISHEPI